MKPCGWLLFVLFPLLLGLTAKNEILKHDDGKQDDKRSMAGMAQAVRFERPSGDYVIDEIQIYGEQYGDGDPLLDVAKIYICDSELVPLSSIDAPFENFRRGKADWAKVKMRPIQPPETFFVLVNFLASATRGVYMGIDDSASENSFTALPRGTLKKFDKGNWMIRVSGSDKIKPEDLPVLDPETKMEQSYDDGEMDSKKSMGGSGHAVEFSAPPGEWYVSHISLHGSLYGGNYNPAQTYFNLFICDKKMRVLSRSAHPYSIFPFGNQPQWVAVEVEPFCVKGKFYVLACFNPAATKGVYLSIDESVKKSHSLVAMPDKPGGKLGSKQEWMIRVSLMKKGEAGGKPEEDAEEEKAEEESEPDAMQLADWQETLEKLEAVENGEGMKKQLATITRTYRDAGKRFGEVYISDHVWIQYVEVPLCYAKAVANLYECCHQVLEKEFGLKDSFCVVPGKRLHVHLLAGEERELQLFTSPESTDFPLVVNTMPTWKRGLSPPDQGGPHIVYGLCHELGHVLMGWMDSRHQWAHYVGSKLVNRVVEKLGEKLWPQPYDYLAEGMARYMGEIEGQTPKRDTDAGTARIFYDVGNRFGLDIWGKVIPWIKENREGQPFGAVRRYYLDDLKAALIDVGCDENKVSEVFVGT
ncbi:MAG: hypothetical protein ABIK28_23000 [Planctomycetota bacterium]